MNAITLLRALGLCSWVLAWPAAERLEGKSNVTQLSYSLGGLIKNWPIA